MPIKVSNTTAESTSTRLIDTGGGFLIEEPVSGKHSSLTARVTYDPGCSCWNTSLLWMISDLLEFIIFNIHVMYLLIRQLVSVVKVLCWTTIRSYVRNVAKNFSSRICWTSSTSPSATTASMYRQVWCCIFILVHFSYYSSHNWLMWNMLNEIFYHWAIVDAAVLHCCMHQSIPYSSACFTNMIWLGYLKVQ